jgi:hypothetical protein
VPAVCQLTGLRELRVNLPRFAHLEGLLQLRQLTQLQLVTALTFDGPCAGIGSQQKVSLSSKVGGY